METLPEDSGGSLLFKRAHELPGFASLTPREMCQQAIPELHTELILRGGSVKIAAVGIKIIDASDGPNFPTEAKQMRSIAASLKLPYLEIHEPAFFPDSGARIQLDEAGRAVSAELNRHGMHYSFESERVQKWAHAIDVETVTAREFQELRGELQQALSTPSGQELLEKLEAQFAV